MDNQYSIFQQLLQQQPQQGGYNMQQPGVFGMYRRLHDRLKQTPLGQTPFSQLFDLPQRIGLMLQNYGGQPNVPGPM